MKKNSWFKCWKPNPDASFNIFCFPHAGGGSITFRDWSRYQSASFQILCARLPGRETRLKEPLLVSVDPIVKGLIEEMKPYLDKDFIFFGHSLGSLICFELACALRKKGLRLPLHMFVSGRRPPQVPTKNPVSSLPEPEFIDELRRYDGTPTILLENPGAMNLFLPILRADFKISDDYVYGNEAPFDFPLSLFNGADDDLATREELLRWREHTNNDFEFVEFPGNHFYITDQGESILKSITARLDK